MNSIHYRESFLSICEDVVRPEQWERISSGDTLVNTGDVLQKVYIIKSGLFKVNIEYQSAQLTIGFLVSGDLSGLFGHDHNLNSPYTIKAITYSDVYVWDRTKISELVNVVPGIGKSIKNTYAMWSMKIVERLKTFVFLPPYQRVATWVSDYHKYEMYQKNSVWAKLSYHDMAEYCNVKPDEFISALSELKRNNIINLTEEDCEVLDWERLHFIINAPT